MENKKEPQSVAYFFKFLDINGGGFLDTLVLYHFFKVRGEGPVGSMTEFKSKFLSINYGLGFASDHKGWRWRPGSDRFLRCSWRDIWCRKAINHWKNYRYGFDQLVWCRMLPLLARHFSHYRQLFFRIISGQGDVVITLLTDAGGFFGYDTRELSVPDLPAETEVWAHLLYTTLSIFWYDKYHFIFYVH